MIFFSRLYDCFDIVLALYLFGFWCVSSELYLANALAQLGDCLEEQTFQPLLPILNTVGKCKSIKDKLAFFQFVIQLILFKISDYFSLNSSYSICF